MRWFFDVQGHMTTSVELKMACYVWMEETEKDLKVVKEKNMMRILFLPASNIEIQIYSKMFFVPAASSHWVLAGVSIQWKHS